MKVVKSLFLNFITIIIITRKNNMKKQYNDLKIIKFNNEQANY